MFNFVRGNSRKIYAVALAEMVLFFFSETLRGTIYRALGQHLAGGNDVTTEFLQSFFLLMMFAMHILFCVIYMLAFKPDSVQYLRIRPKQAAAGLAFGILINAVISFGAIVGTQMTAVFCGFTVFLVPIFIANMIQCAAEEVLLRAFVPSFMEGKYTWNVIAVLSGILFILHHVGNMRAFGFSVLFCLNVFLMGCLLIMVVKHTRNVWWAIGVHSGWNFTQEFIFGLPNSGVSSSLAIFRSTNASTNFFFDEVYGNEGSLLCTVVLLVSMLLIAIYFGRKKDPQA